MLFNFRLVYTPERRWLKSLCSCGFFLFLQDASLALVLLFWDLCFDTGTVLKKTVLLLFAIKTCLRPPRSITHIFKWSHERLGSSKRLSVAKIFLKIVLINSRRTPKIKFWMSFKIKKKSVFTVLIYIAHHHFVQS